MGVLRGTEGVSVCVLSSFSYERTKGRTNRDETLTTSNFSGERELQGRFTGSDNMKPITEKLHLPIHSHQSQEY